MLFVVVFCDNDTPQSFYRNRGELLADDSLELTEATLDDFTIGGKLLIQKQFLIIRIS